jgi:argininosuccinate lyase
LLEKLEFDGERMRATANDPALGATDLAEHLVRQGVPFRHAHEIVGRLVRHAEQLGVSLRDVPEAELARVAPELDLVALQVLSPARAVAGRALPGGPAPAQVMLEAERLADELKGLGYDV